MPELKASPGNEPGRLVRCARLMEALERELRRTGLWESQPPAPEAFHSTMPFSADCLRFEQWLQWMFIPRVRALLEQGGPLPGNSAIQPMAEEMFKQTERDTELLVVLLGEFDRLINS